MQGACKVLLGRYLEVMYVYPFSPRYPQRGRQSIRGNMLSIRKEPPLPERENVHTKMLHLVNQNRKTNQKFIKVVLWEFLFLGEGFQVRPLKRRPRGQIVSKLFVGCFHPSSNLMNTTNEVILNIKKVSLFFQTLNHSFPKQVD